MSLIFQITHLKSALAKYELGGGFHTATDDEIIALLNHFLTFHLVFGGLGEQ